MAIAFDLSAGKSRDRQANTLSSIGDAIVTTDAHGRVTFLNAVAQALTGWAREQALGQALEPLALLRGGQSPRVVC